MKIDHPKVDAYLLHIACHVIPLYLERHTIICAIRRIYPCQCFLIYDTDVRKSEGTTYNIIH